MGRLKDMVGEEHGTLKVLSYAGQKHKTSYWTCECQACGRVVDVARSNLLSPLLRTCGCGLRAQGPKSKSWRGAGELSAMYLSKTRFRASRKGLVFDLDLKFLWELFLSQDRKCRLTGDALTLARSREGYFHGEGNASIDRIDSTLGYTKDNVQWVTKDVNCMKWHLDEGRFIEVCKKVVEHRRVT